VNKLTKATKSKEKRVVCTVSYANEIEDRSFIGNKSKRKTGLSRKVKRTAESDGNPLLENDRTAIRVNNPNVKEKIGEEKEYE
jgi:hypothetical protein